MVRLPGWSTYRYSIPVFRGSAFKAPLGDCADLCRSCQCAGKQAMDLLPSASHGLYGGAQRARRGHARVTSGG